ncbi:MAG: pyridoxal phosphate-dependent aminotransferase [Planctomycetota bacterium]|nr:MAG: pyridoxal phosphate-dependent aminotransferase [Planctomycetota bacterium]
MNTNDHDAPILLSPPHITGEERRFVEDAFRTNWIAPLGPNVDGFEREMCAHLGGSISACATSSGTAAIHLGLILLGVMPGDAVLCSSFTFVATANPIHQLGANPIFIDSEPESWNMSPRALARALDALAREGRTPRACVTVDLYGQCCDYAAIAPLCAKHGVPILEDAAEALGAHAHGRPCGTFGAIAAFSFNGNKIITTSGGGMLVAHDARHCERARFLATQARDPAPHYEHSVAGFNYRLSNICAGVGRGQLLAIDDRVARRRAIFARYQAALASMPGVRFMPEPSWSHATRWLTVLTVDPALAGCTRDELIAALAADRIESRPAWKPMHMQPLFEGAPMFAHDPSAAPVCEQLFEQGICLPSGSSMSFDAVDRVIRTATRALARTRALA